DLLGAYLHINQYDGDLGTWSFQVYHAGCLNNYNCYNGGVYGPPGNVGTGWSALDVTNIYNTLKNTGDYGGWLMLRGQECGCNSYKGFSANTAFVEFDYNNRPT